MHRHSFGIVLCWLIKKKGSLKSVRQMSLLIVNPMCLFHPLTPTCVSPCWGLRGVKWVGLHGLIGSDNPSLWKKKTFGSDMHGSCGPPPGRSILRAGVIGTLSRDWDELLVVWMDRTLSEYGSLLVLKFICASWFLTLNFIPFGVVAQRLPLDILLGTFFKYVRGCWRPFGKFLIGVRGN